MSFLSVLVFPFLLLSLFYIFMATRRKAGLKGASRVAQQAEPDAQVSAMSSYPKLYLLLRKSSQNRERKRILKQCNKTERIRRDRYFSY